MGGPPPEPKNLEQVIDVKVANTYEDIEKLLKEGYTYVTDYGVVPTKIFTKKIWQKREKEVPF